MALERDLVYSLAFYSHVLLAAGLAGAGVVLLQPGLLEVPMRVVGASRNVSS